MVMRLTLSGDRGLEEIRTLEGNCFLDSGRLLDVAVSQTDVPATEGLRPKEFTPREREVLSLLVAGMRNKAIGAVLGIADATVRAHVKHLFRKLDVHTRTAAVATALRLGLVQL